MSVRSEEHSDSDSDDYNDVWESRNVDPIEDLMEITTFSAEIDDDYARATLVDNKFTELKI